MATRWGWETYQWLLARGWQAGPPLPEEQCGDPCVLDPETAEIIDVYSAVKRERQRTGAYPPHLDKSE